MWLVLDRKPHWRKGLAQGDEVIDWGGEGSREGVLVAVRGACGGLLFVLVCGGLLFLRSFACQMLTFGDDSVRCDC